MPYRLLTAFALAMALAACSTTEDVAEATADAARTGVNAAGDVIEAGAGVVTDAAGAVYSTAEDVFDGDDDAMAAALIRPTSASGARAQGVVRFQETGDGLQVMVSLTGLTPGRHGIHIHQNASCAAGPDGTPAGAAGGHWDPINTENHGAPSADPMNGKHLGDLGNITADARGNAQTTFTIDAFRPGEHDVSGHALVVHGGMDDLQTDPAGDSGMRMGCGLIESGM